MERIKRIQGWEKALSDFLLSAKDTPFRWGVNDCIMFPAKALQAMTRKHFIQMGFEQGYKYTTKAGAGEMLDKHFGGNVENVFAHYLGNARDDIGFARRGDIVIVQHNDETIGGVVDDSGRNIACAGRKGLVRFPKREALKYWRIGD